MAVKLVIFDLDGTLVNTIEDVCDCFNQALERCGFARCPQNVIEPLIGKPLEVIVAGLLPKGASEDEIAEVASEYRLVYGASSKPNTRPYPGVYELLRKLACAGVHLAVNSNKPHQAALEVIEKMFPDIDMSVSGYGDVSTPKPSCEGAHLLMQAVGASPEETVYVGDTIIDLETAQNAGCACVLVTWGQGDFSEIGASWRVEIVSSAEELEAKLMRR